MRTSAEQNIKRRQRWLQQLFPHCYSTTLHSSPTHSAPGLAALDLELIGRWRSHAQGCGGSPSLDLSFGSSLFRYPFFLNGITSPRLTPSSDGISKLVLLHLFGVTVAGAAAAVAVRYHRQRKQRPTTTMDLRLMPRLVLTDSGRVEELERFSQYVGNCMIRLWHFPISSFLKWQKAHIHP